MPRLFGRCPALDHNGIDIGLHAELQVIRAFSMEKHVIYPHRYHDRSYSQDGGNGSHSTSRTVDYHISLKKAVIVLINHNSLCTLFIAVAFYIDDHDGRIL